MNYRRARVGGWHVFFYTDFARHVDYIHYNPVRHGYADAVAYWPYSSIHRYIARGSIPVDWGGTFDDQGDFGER